MTKTMRFGVPKKNWVFDWLDECKFLKKASDSRSRHIRLLVPITLFSSVQYRTDSVGAVVPDTKCIGIVIPPHNNMTKINKIQLSPVATRIAKPTTKSRRLTSEGSTSTAGT